MSEEVKKYNCLFSVTAQHPHSHNQQLLMTMCEKMFFEKRLEYNPETFNAISFPGSQFGIEI